MAPLPSSPPLSPLPSRPLAPPSPSSPSPAPTERGSTAHAYSDYAHIVRSLERRSIDRCASVPSLAGGGGPPPPALEADLRLAAQIGQTLLGEKTALQSRLDAAERAKDALLERLAANVKETVGLQRRLDEANANLDSADASNRTLLASLEDDRKTISRISVDAGKAVAASTALKHLQRAHDDLAQELAAERRRADGADAKARKLAVRVAELEERLARASADLDEMRQDKVLSARRSLDALNRARSAGIARTGAPPPLLAAAPQPDDGGAAMEPHPEAKELLRMVETLARENTLLRSESMELRGLLDDSRDEQCDLRSAIAASQDVLVAPNEGDEGAAADGDSASDDLRPKPRRLSLASSAFSAQRDAPDLSGATGDVSFPSWASSSLSHSARAGDLSRTLSASSSHASDDLAATAATSASRRIGVLARPPPVSSASTGAVGLARRQPARGHGRRAMSMDVTQQVQPFNASAPTSPRLDYSPSTRPASIFSTTSEDPDPRPRRHHRPLSLSLGPSVFPLVPEGDDTDEGASRPVSPFTRQPPSAHCRRSSHAPSPSLVGGTGLGLGTPFPFRSPRARSRSPDRADAATQTSPPAAVPRVREPSTPAQSTAASDFSRSPSPRPAPSSSSSVSVHSQDTPSSSGAARVEQRTAALAQLIEHAAKLLGRVQGADIATQEKRLRKQNLPGDVRHLAQANLRDLVNDIDSVRTHFRRVVDLERASHARAPPPALASTAPSADTSLVTRREFVSLVKLVRDLLFEASRLRMLVNRVQLDPSLAAALRDLDVPDAFDALNAGRATTPAAADTALSAGGGLLAPLSRLFGGGGGGGGGDGEPHPAAAAAAATLGHRPSSAQLRVPPAKRGGSSTVSTATVNVEFGSGQVRQAESGSPGARGLSAAPPPPTQPRQASVKRELASIFAGASSRSTGAAVDSWVAVPPPAPPVAAPIAVGPPHSAAPASRLASAASYIPFGRLLSSYRPAMSSTTNAVLDSLPHGRPNPASAAGRGDEPLPPTLLERQLRPRGLSDSSIRSTYLAHANPHHRVVTAAGLALSAEPSRAAALASPRVLPASAPAAAGSAGDALRVQLDEADADADANSAGVPARRSVSRRPSTAQLRARASSSRLGHRDRDHDASPPRPPLPVPVPVSVPVPVPPLVSTSVAAAPSSATSESSLSLVLGPGGPASPGSKSSSARVEPIAMPMTGVQSQTQTQTQSQTQSRSPPEPGAAAGLLGSLASSLAKHATGAGRDEWKERGRMG
ncbi:hypothetical protein JCM3770_003673 [Rhodotorula araucariae]